MTARVRWVCPNGHPAVLGSTRPPLNSIVRYCLVCSASAGVLVERTAPTLEAKRASAAEAAKVKRAKSAAAAKAAKDREAAKVTARYTVGDLDLRVELARLVKLRAFGGKDGRLAKRPPELVISRRTSVPRSRLGYAEYWANRITVATYPVQDSADARETLLHEIVHIFVGHSDDEGHHGPTFRRTLRAAMIEAYKVDPVLFHGSFHGHYAMAIRKRERSIAASTTSK